MLYSAVVRIRVTDINHRRSPFVQRGLEIPVEVLVKMPVDVRNEEAMKRYKALVSHIRVCACVSKLQRTC